ncbi:hypothetical protein GW17_00036802 [Ensete ventricosum]|nr:hypothetical protein GW17_00036802 [Ensete ventricosum]
MAVASTVAANTVVACARVLRVPADGARPRPVHGFYTRRPLGCGRYMRRLSLACEATDCTASVACNCSQPLVTDPRASVARCSCPRDQPNPRPGLSAAWPPLLLCTHMLLSAVLPQADTIVHSDVVASTK